MISLDGTVHKARTEKVQGKVNPLGVKSDWQLCKRHLLPIHWVLCFLGYWSGRKPNHGECSHSIPHFWLLWEPRELREKLAGGSVNECLVIFKCCGFCPFPQMQEEAQHLPSGLLLSHHSMEPWLCRGADTGFRSWQAGVMVPVLS